MTGTFDASSALYDLVHRRAEAAGGVEQDDDRVVVVVVRAGDLVVDVALRDRIDVVLELGREDTRPRRRS